LAVSLILFGLTRFSRVNIWWIGVLFSTFLSALGSSLRILGVQAVILNFHGNGQFSVSENYVEEVVISEFLSPQNTDSFPFNEPMVIFKDSEETEAYIKPIN
jgi:hypothetical protein